MLSAVLRTITAHALVERGDRLVVAVSGGPDSMALLHVLWEARERLELTIEVAGVDHGLRAAAAGELDLVAARAAALDLLFHRLRVDVAGARRGASLQDAARRARLGALEALASARGARRVALGHQADDQAETILFRILRGTGLAGLKGIPYVRAPFIRPLLDIRRAEVLRYLRRRSIPFVEDPSNADPRFSRARLRHRVLPMLAEENPRVAEALLALAASARAAGVSPDITPALTRRVADAVGRLRARGGSTTLDLAGRRRIDITYGVVRIGPRGRSAATPALVPVTLERPGRVGWLDGTLAIEEVAARPAAARGGEAEFDADRLDWPLQVRARKAGDRMRPRGGRGGRKLSDLMIDAKIARAGREALPVLTDARGALLFVPGLRPAEIARPDGRTRRRVRVQFTPAPTDQESTEEAKGVFDGPPFGGNTFNAPGPLPPKGTRRAPKS